MQICVYPLFTQQLLLKDHVPEVWVQKWINETKTPVKKDFILKWWGGGGQGEGLQLMLSKIK